MKAVILAGGLGSRLSEETDVKPKPMVEIGGKPMLWHIMKVYSAQGVNDFVVCLGYSGYVIKEYFANYALHTSDVTFDLRSDDDARSTSSTTEPWRVTLVDTGEHTMTGGRVKRVLPVRRRRDVLHDLRRRASPTSTSRALIAFHREHGRLATVTAVQPPGRFGALGIEGAAVDSFEEKPRGDGAWTNGGFFVLEPGVADYIDGDNTVWEQRPMRRLAADGQLSAFRHQGFWQAMDTLRERLQLEELWATGHAPWLTW